MKRSFFLLGLTGAAFAIVSVRVHAVRHGRLRGKLMAGSCANRRRKRRWSGYTAADIS
jgi:hypothetical protein